MGFKRAYLIKSVNISQNAKETWLYCRKTVTTWLTKVLLAARQGLARGLKRSYFFKKVLIHRKMQREHGYTVGRRLPLALS